MKKEKLAIFVLFLAIAKIKQNKKPYKNVQLKRCFLILISKLTVQNYVDVSPQKLRWLRQPIHS